MIDTQIEDWGFLRVLEKHATVKLGEYTVPLIGVPIDATQQECCICGKSFHLTDITLDKTGCPRCQNCLTL